MPTPREKRADNYVGWQKIKRMARRLKFQKELTKAQSKRVQVALSRATEKGLLEKAQKQQRFLDRALEVRPEYFLLCSIALSYGN